MNHFIETEKSQKEKKTRHFPIGINCDACHTQWESQCGAEEARAKGAIGECIHRYIYLYSYTLIDI